MSQMASCVVIYWPPNGQRAKCETNVSNLCPRSQMKRLNVEGRIKPRRKCNKDVKIKCAMQTEQIDGLTTNHSLAPLLEQERMWVLNVKEMESSFKINLRDVLWWKTIKDVYRHVASIITKFSKERCISLVVKGRPSCTTRKQDWSRWGPPSTWETYSSKTGILKYKNLEHEYGATKAPLLKKVNGAQFSIKKKLIPLKDINSQV
jgi:hypothetical protein